MSDASNTITGVWECDECGFTRRGTLNDRPEYCPNCDAPGDAFSFWSDVDEEEQEEVAEVEEVVEVHEEDASAENEDQWS